MTASYEESSFEAAVRDRCRNFGLAGVWPHLRHMAPEAWLDNFLPGERAFAHATLGAVVYYHGEPTNTLLEAAVRQLAPRITSRKATYSERRAEWIRFLFTVRVLFPDPDDGNPSKSGPLFVRKSRQLFGWRNEQMIDHDSVADAVVADPNQAVLLVDDFAGTGEQFLQCWNRKRRLASGGETSYAELAARGHGRFHFCPTVANYVARDEIAHKAPEVLLSPAHLLVPEIALNSNAPLLLAPEFRDGFREFVEAASARAGIADSDTWGYGEQGLALGFEHGVPDGTFPLLTWEGDGWTPLLHRA